MNDTNGIRPDVSQVDIRTDRSIVNRDIILSDTFVADRIAETRHPEKLVHSSESGDVVAIAQGYFTASISRHFRQNVLSLRSQSLHEAGPRDEAQPWHMYV